MKDTSDVVAFLRDEKRKRDELIGEVHALRAQVTRLIDANEGLLQATVGDTRFLYEQLRAAWERNARLDDELRALSVRYSYERERRETLERATTP